MRYLQLNPETNPVRHEFMDGIEIQSITNSRIYAYAGDNGGMMFVPEPGRYISSYNPLTDTSEYIKIDEYLTSVDKTEEYLNYLLTNSPDDAPAQTEEDYVSVSGCSVTDFEGTHYVYYVRFHKEGYDDFYQLEDENHQRIPQVETALADGAYTVGTYNLANGTSVEITEIDLDSGSLLLRDSQGRTHEMNSIIDYQYYTIPGHGDLYFDKISGAWCRPAGDGTYYIGDSERALPAKGCIFKITYQSGGESVTEEHYAERGPIENPPYYASMTATTVHSGSTEPWLDDPEWYTRPEEERPPIEYYTWETTGWTTVEITFGHHLKYKDGNGNDVYAVFQLPNGLQPNLYTGHTMEDLQWWSDDYDEHPSGIRWIDFDVVRIPAEEDKVVTEFVVPGVAFETDGNSVYYNRTGVPVFDIEQGINFFMVQDRDAVFDATMHQHILYYRDFGGGGSIRVSPDSVEHIWFNGVDRTQDFKSGAVTDVNLWKMRYTEGRQVVDVSEIRVEFTESFFMNGRLNATEREGMR